MARAGRKTAWYGYADGSSRHSETGVAVITSVSLYEIDRPVTLRVRLEREPDRPIFVELTEDEARKMAEDVLSLLRERKAS